MKKIYILPILLMFFFSNCEKVVDVDVPTIPPKLIIDASFEVFFDENPVTANTVVKLRLSADYFDDVIPAALNATVFLTNLSDNSVINFSDTNADGDYEPINSFIPADNVTYELTVIYDNETYKGTATKIKSTPLTSVIQGDETLFSGNETELKISLFFEIKITFPFLTFNFCCKNSGSFTLPTKHNPWESFFSAVIKICCLAINLTSFLSKSPIGNITFDNWYWESWHKK